MKAHGLRKYQFPALLVGCCAVLLLTGCSLLGGNKEPELRPQVLSANPGLLGIKQVWRVEAGALPALDVAAYVQGDFVSVASKAGVVTTINATTGAVRSQVSVGEAVATGVGGYLNWRAVVTQSNQVIVLDDERVLWRQPLAAQSFTAPLVAGDRVFVLTADHALYAFDLRTGNRLWTKQRQGESLALRQSGVLLPFENTLVAGFGGRLAGISPDNGVTRWEIPLATSRGVNDIDRLIQLTGRVSRVDSSICAVAFQSAVGCIDAAQGRVVWTSALNAFQGVHGDADAIFAAAHDGVVMGWKRANGEKIWSTDTLKYRRISAPLLLGRSVVVGDDAGNVYMLGKEDGVLIDRVTTDASGLASSPFVAANTLVIATKNGNLYGFRPQ